ncbi:MAG: bifunctional methylenetetrahydrofolate dehydrogenase/methenyltetrahydrofolate cyclohydrolase FolD [Pseudomonadota bacterium]
MERASVMAHLIDGKDVAASLRGEIASDVAAFKDKYGETPGLAVVLVGEDPASQVYVKNKHRAAEKCGIRSIVHRVPASTSQSALEDLIESLNTDKSVDGILVQMPLPGGLDANRAIGRIDPSKDVDGLTEVSAGRLSLGKEGLRPCTPEGCVKLLKTVHSNLSGLHAVVIGRSILVGKPLAALLVAENCTVTIAHSRTSNLAEVCRTADILCAAVGRPEFVEADWIKPGATVIDIGINRVTAPDDAGASRLVGDVDFAGAQAVAGAITPVPGGVGPMTIACLLGNTLKAARAMRSS